MDRRVSGCNKEDVMGALLSQLEEQNDKIEKRLWTIERQVAFLNKMYDKILP